MEDPVGHSAVVSRSAPGRRVPGGVRVFATPADEPRTRRISDAVVGAGAAAALLVISLAAVPPPGFMRAVAELVGSAPRFLDGLWQVLADGAIVVAVAVLVAAVVRRRVAIARDVVVAALVAAVLSILVARAVQGSWPDVWDGLRSALPPPWYAAPRIAVPGAMLFTASPHLTLPARRWSRRVVGLAVVSVTALGAATPLGALAGLLVAGLAAAVVHLAFGSSGGRPGLDLVRRSLAELGVHTRHLEIAPRQEAGLFFVDAVDERGEPLIVKVYGRDAHDAAVMSTLWRTVWFRSAGSPIRLGRIQQVEHEAFLTLFARQAGVATDTVVRAGETAADDALLVLRRTSRPLVDLGEPDRPDEVVAGCWRLLARLHGAGIVHGRLDERNVVVDGSEVGVVEVAALGPERRRPAMELDPACGVAPPELGLQQLAEEVVEPHRGDARVDD